MNYVPPKSPRSAASKLSSCGGFRPGAADRVDIISLPLWWNGEEQGSQQVDLEWSDDRCVVSNIFRGICILSGGPVPAGWCRVLLANDTPVIELAAATLPILTRPWPSSKDGPEAEGLISSASNHDSAIRAHG